jgi:Sigma-54 interaction domain
MFSDGADLEAVSPMSDRSSSSTEIHVGPREWVAIREAKPNVLICGEPMFVDSFLGLLAGHCASPIRRISHSGALGALSGIEDGTVVLENAEQYKESEQRAVLDWLANTDAAIQLITTTGKPLFDLVEQGQFLDSLFYRINTIYLELSCPAEPTLPPLGRSEHRIN